MTYDPLGRLWEIDGGSAGRTLMVHDGPNLVAEYDPVSGALLRRYVHGPGADTPVAKYEGAATGFAARDYYSPDERGSVMAVVNADGSVAAIKAYDEYGITQNAAVGRFGYTGQAWLDEIGLYYYKARMYSPQLGRFLQTDPTGYGDGMNMYGYTGGDPVNSVDPDGRRRMRNSELSFARRFYGNTLNYSAIDIDWTMSDRAMVWWNKILIPINWRDNALRDEGTFIHELFHIYQIQVMGYTMASLGWTQISRLGVQKWIYPTKVDTSKPLTDYNTEQQAVLAEMCFNGDRGACDILTAYDKRLGAIYVYGSQSLRSAADARIDMLRAKLGPLSTSKMIAYMNKCFVGDVDFCAGGTVQPVEDLNEVSGE